MAVIGAQPVEAGAPTRKPEPIRVLLVCDHVGYDGHLHGSGRVMAVTASALQGDAIRAYAHVLQPGGALEEVFRRENRPVTFLGYNRFDPRQVLTLIRLIREHSIDVVHAWDFGAATYGRIAALVTGRPAIVHIHSHHSPYQRRGFPRYVRLAYRLLAPTTARAIAIASSIREFGVDHMGFDEAQIVTISNPAPPGTARPVADETVAALRAEYGLEPDTPVIGSLTRFYEAKGLRYLIAAMPDVLAEVPDARLLLVGDGPLRADLEKQAHQLGVEDQVMFVGFKHNVGAHLRLFTVMAMPSLEEGMPVAALESLGAGVPMVATRVGGLPDIVKEDATGFLVEPRDSAGLGEALLRVLTRPELRARLSETCLKERRRFSLEHYREQLIRLYREVLQ